MCVFYEFVWRCVQASVQPGGWWSVSSVGFCLFVLETVSLELAMLAGLTGQWGLEILLSAPSSDGITDCHHTQPWHGSGDPRVASNFTHWAIFSVPDSWINNFWFVFSLNIEIQELSQENRNIKERDVAECCSSWLNMASFRYILHYSVTVHRLQYIPKNRLCPVHIAFLALLWSKHGWFRHLRHPVVLYHLQIWGVSRSMLSVS